MKIDTCHNFGIGVIGVQKNSKIPVFDENGKVVLPRKLSPPRGMGRSLCCFHSYEEQELNWFINYF